MILPKIDPQAALEQSRVEDVRRKLGLDKVRSSLAPTGQEEKKLREATEGFEAVFIQQLWKQMRQSVPKEGFLHSREEDAYLSMFDEELSKKMSSAGGIGLGDMMYRELKEQLARSAGDSLPRAGEGGALGPLHTGPMSLHPDNGVKSLDEADAMRPLDETDLSRGRFSGFRTEPRFDPLGDTNPEVRDALPSPPEIMQRVTALATRIRLQAAGDGVAQDGGAPAAVQASIPVDAAEQAPGAGPVAVAQQPAAESAPASVAPAAAAVSASAAPAAASVSAPTGPGTMHWPAQGEVSSGFGWRADKVTGAQEWHSGLDIVGAEGDPVQSCWEGKVIFAGQRGRFGNLVVLEHPGGWRSYYGHNKVNLVSEGDQVAAGSKIAELGSTGRTSDAHLHFEIRQDDRAENPNEVMERLQAGLSGANSN